ncbi:MAG: hypothetical protein M3347_03655, partial [Armatimonadota bacterium]|nr:hypothetical protein [Armatimonadota bacterium]
VSGSSSLLDRVAGVQARLKDLKIQSTTVPATDIPLEAVDASGQVIEGVQIEPAVAQITATLREDKIVGSH